MTYYLVAVLDDSSYNCIERIQKEICYNYKLFDKKDKLPKLHITIETIDDPDLDKLIKLLSDILKGYSSFKVKSDGVICFDPPFKSVNLKIQDCDKALKLSKDINYILKKEKFKVREDIKDYALHISLANSYFSNKQWSDFEYASACNFAKENNNENFIITINELQLWKPVNNEREMIIYKFPLT
ncbi:MULTISPECIES: 2'-5' RNA ligase family protein [Clostridium]|uniref:2'-5' RNA ligase family protein n=1 Tax=Clostridium faecium TaxID=2762223 RepID=A0ABR8YRW7_9CLOT|nr:MULTISPECIES: 2'-5' RNA ligase family protein [Clostridium]MBD8046986.1 2'-5' RNA ligase family protein [Clostridium faecium]MDU1349250.1 2'-5' RNA ligase family protein [Clostridium argentinense]